MAKRDLSNIPPGQTECSVCGVTKDNTEFSFYKERKTSNGYRLMVNTNCRCCQKLRRTELSKLKKLHKAPPYGTPCDLCDKPVFRNWQLDHDHNTGKIRGWLCKQCNTGLGNLGDNLESLQKAVDYLKKTE
jgi:hypothetical protein